MATIHFFNENINFNLPQKLLIKTWIKQIITTEKANIQDLNFIFCSDAYLHQLNIQFLNHDDFTDILTFDRSEEDNVVSGDIYISIDRIKENAEILKEEFRKELKRIMIHGVYHLLGFRDKEKHEKDLMTEKENEALSLWELLDVPRGTSNNS